MKIFQSILCIMLLGISVASWGQEKKAYRNCLYPALWETLREEGK